MAVKAFLVACASALFVQVIAEECIRVLAPAPIIYRAPCDAHYDNIIASNLASASGGGLGVITSSLYAPNGLSVLSENKIAGELEAIGHLPVLAAVALEGTLPTSGSAGTVYSCGNEEVGITSESLAAAGIDAARYSAGYGSAFGANAAAAASVAAAAAASDAAAAAASDAAAAAAFDAAAANSRKVGARFFSARRGSGY